MPADTRLYLQFEGKVKDGQFDAFKNWVEKNRDNAAKAGSDFWSPSSDGKILIHNEAFSNIENFKRHMNEWVPTIMDDIGNIADIEKIQASGPITDEQKLILNRNFSVTVEYCENI